MSPKELATTDIETRIIEMKSSVVVEEIFFTSWNSRIYLVIINKKKKGGNEGGDYDLKDTNHQISLKLLAEAVLLIEELHYVGVQLSHPLQ